MVSDRSPAKKFLGLTKRVLVFWTIENLWHCFQGRFLHARLDQCCAEFNFLRQRLSWTEDELDLFSLIDLVMSCHVWLGFMHCLRTGGRSLRRRVYMKSSQRSILRIPHRHHLHHLQHLHLLDHHLHHRRRG